MRILIIVAIASLIIWYILKFYDKAKSNENGENENSESLNIDTILDKISKKGIKSLTSSERKFLDRNK